MAWLAHRLPQELRYWVLVTAGVEHIEDHEEVPRVLLMDVIGRMHARMRGHRRDPLTDERDTSQDPLKALPSPSEAMIQSPAFQAVWERIKDWDIDAGAGYSGATGSHVAAILGALQDKYMPAPNAAQAARDFAASLALCAREMPDTLAAVEYEGQAARHPEYTDVAEHDADSREDLAAERRASAAVPTFSDQAIEAHGCEGVRSRGGATTQPTTNTHRVVIEFDGGAYFTKLIHPESGCQPATICADCGRDTRDPESEPCDVCKDGLGEGCWVEGWFDNEATDVLRGRVELEVDPEWQGGQMLAQITDAGPPVPE